MKRAIDLVLSGGAIVILSSVLAGITILIKLDSKAPVLFKQKRVGKNKEFFEIWKIRSMYTDTPKDLLTHMRDNPDAYITKVGKFLRRTSLDELPQIFYIFIGRMSIIDPRPALWNQDDLVEECDKYGANDVTLRLTGWAQINGRDGLEIPVKVKFGGVVEGGTGEMHKEGKDTDVVVSPESSRRRSGQEQL